MDAYKHKIIVAETLIDQSILTKIPHHRIRLSFIWYDRKLENFLHGFFDNFTRNRIGDSEFLQEILPQRWMGFQPKLPSAISPEFDFQISIFAAFVQMLRRLRSKRRLVTKIYSIIKNPISRHALNIHTFPKRSITNHLILLKSSRLWSCKLNFNVLIIIFRLNYFDFYPYFPYQGGW